MNQEGKVTFPETVLWGKYLTKFWPIFIEIGLGAADLELKETKGSHLFMSFLIRLLNLFYNMCALFHNSIQERTKRQKRSSR